MDNSKMGNFTQKWVSLLFPYLENYSDKIINDLNNKGYGSLDEFYSGWGWFK